MAQVQTRMFVSDLMMAKECLQLRLAMAESLLSMLLQKGGLLAPVSELGCGKGAREHLRG